MGCAALRTIYRQIPQFLKRMEEQVSETKSVSRALVVSPASQRCMCPAKGQNLLEEDSGHENDQIRVHQRQSAYCS